MYEHASDRCTLVQVRDGRGAGGLLAGEEQLGRHLGRGRLHQASEVSTVYSVTQTNMVIMINMVHMITKLTHSHNHVPTVQGERAGVRHGLHADGRHRLRGDIYHIPTPAHT